MKNKFVMISIGLFIGIIICLGTYEGLAKTSDDKFCIVCHEMTPMVISYQNDVHEGNGQIGFKAQCVDCHMPHNNIVNYIYTKAKNGVVEGAIYFFGDTDNINWHKNRDNKDKFVYDDGCIKCHSNLKNITTISQKGKQMHKHYSDLKNTNNQIGCAQCHIETGHNGLMNVLNYFNPEFESYTKQAQKRKDELLKDFNKD